ncbi:MAG: hypothetical protein JSV26_04630 [bacterium]|nr:MAG: hypothetical protein JSV26_04630 [bacterium]
MAVHSNYMVKVKDASLPDVRKALQGAGIEVRSILLVNKEEVGSPEAPAEEGTGEESSE